MTIKRTALNLPAAMDPAIEAVIKAIGARMHHTDREARDLLEKYRRGKLQIKTVVHRIRALVVTPYPDLWVRFCKVAPVPQHMWLPRPQVDGTLSPGKFSMSAELLTQHVLPALSYPSVGRLASTCKWMRARVGPHGLADAMERYTARTHGRFQVQAGTIRLHTIDEEPIILHMVGNDIPGLEFAGRNFIGSLRLDYNSVIDRQWPERQFPHTTDMPFRSLFQTILEHSDVKIWAKTKPGDRDRLLLYLYAHGDAMRDKNAVYMVMVEFAPSTWGPVYTLGGRMPLAS